MTIFEKLTQLECEASDFGFRWENTTQIMDQIQSECSEIKDHLNDFSNPEELQNEIGDLLHAVFSLCVFCNFDPKQTLEKSVNKFERRFNAVKQLAAEKGLDSLNGHAFAELMTFWDKAKQQVG